jgi:hypothetical protein
MCTEALNQFLLKPQKFMRANIVMVIANVGSVGGEKTFYFRKSAKVGQNMVNDLERMDVYSLNETNLGGDTKPVNIWWCPYEPNSFHGVTLPGAGGPNIMFTYAMDGCTLAVGSQTPEKAVRVHHINWAKATENMRDASKQERAEQQYTVQRRIARNLMQNPSLVDPEDYYDPAKAIAPVPDGAKISTVTFGRRSSTSGWKFYTHQWYTVQGFREDLKFLGTKIVIDPS